MRAILIALTLLLTLLPAHADGKKETFFSAFSVACEVGARSSQGAPLCRTFAGTAKTEGECFTMLMAAAQQLAATAVKDFEIVEVKCLPIEVSAPEAAL